MSTTPAPTPPAEPVLPPRDADAEERRVVRNGKRIFLKGDRVVGELPRPAPRGLAAAERLQEAWHHGALLPAPGK